MFRETYIQRGKDGQEEQTVNPRPLTLGAVRRTVLDLMELYEVEVERITVVLSDGDSIEWVRT